MAADPVSSPGPPQLLAAEAVALVLSPAHAVAQEAEVQELSVVEELAQVLWTKEQR